MKIWISSLIIAITAGLAGCADTPKSETKVAGASAATVKNPDEVTCRSVVRTGTRIGSKKCMTNRAWAQASRDAREATDDIQRRSTHTPAAQGN
jgi:hypothetical protein